MLLTLSVHVALVEGWGTALHMAVDPGHPADGRLANTLILLM
jgi:hypothetical protein